MTFKNNRAPLLSIIKLYASFHHHMWIQTGVTVRKRLSWVVTSVTLTFDLWPWPFAWTPLVWLVITPENFTMMQWWEHSEKGVTDRQTDWTIHRAAWSQLKNIWKTSFTRLNGISRKIQQLPCKKMHLSVKWQSFCVDPNRLLVSSDWVSDKIDATFQTELWKKIQKLYKRKSVWKCQ